MSGGFSSEQLFDKFKTYGRHAIRSYGTVDAGLALENGFTGSRL
jgi:hypothetical protein